MTISSQASKEEGSTTSGLPHMKTQVSPNALPPLWGEDIVSSEWKHSAVKNAFNGNWSISDSGCWEWTKGTSHGYGQLRVHEVFGSSPLYAHRVSFLLNHSPIPLGMVICHKCDNHLCVNPEHLFMGTPNDNVQDMVKKGRSCSGEKNGQAKISDALVEKIRAITGKKQYEIAIEYGLSDAQVSRILKGSRRSSAQGEVKVTHGNAKLNENLVLRIYELHDNGLNYTEIQNIIGVSKATVRDAILGKTWKKLYLRHRV